VCTDAKSSFNLLKNHSFRSAFVEMKKHILRRPFSLKASHFCIEITMPTEECFMFPLEAPFLTQKYVANTEKQCNQAQNTQTRREIEFCTILLHLHRAYLLLDVMQGVVKQDSPELSAALSLSLLSSGEHLFSEISGAP